MHGAAELVVVQERNGRSTRIIYRYVCMYVMAHNIHIHPVNGIVVGLPVYFLHGTNFAKAWQLSPLTKRTLKGKKCSKNNRDVELLDACMHTERNNIQLKMSGAVMQSFQRHKRVR